MNYKLIKLVLGTALISYSLTSCNNTPEGTKTETTAQTTEESESTKTNEVEKDKNVKNKIYNANLITQDELSLLELSDGLSEKIMSNRPFLTINELNSLLDSGENKSELYAKLFVPLNLNTTAEEDFKIIPGVGNKMAHEFEEYRPYKSIKQFRKEIGKYVDDEEVSRYENYVFVPVELNTASKEDILALPGVGEKMAHEFEEYRPYKSMKQFRKEIGKYVDDNELKRLERFVYIK